MVLLELRRYWYFLLLENDLLARIIVQLIAYSRGHWLTNAYSSRGDAAVDQRCSLALKQDNSIQSR